MAPEKRSAIIRGETSKDKASMSDTKLAKEFYSTFRIYWQLFVKLIAIATDRGFHDVTRKDAVGFAHNLELLLLGSLFFLGWSTTFIFIATQSEIDSEVHRTWHHHWTKFMASISNEYIYLPRNNEELCFVVDIVVMSTTVSVVGVGNIDVGNDISIWLLLFHR